MSALTADIAAIVRLQALDAELKPGYDFQQNERGQTRYTVSDRARWEILVWLLKLSLEVAARERGEFAR